jgi:protoporphyrinogen IX oxidase
MAYLWFKSFHIVGMVAWFGGLFYLVRIFIYHVEANQQSEPLQSQLKQQYHLMEKRAYGIIGTPAMVITVSMAIAMLIIQPDLLKQGWLHIKLGFVALLIAYHFYCGRLIRQLAEDRCGWGSQQLRALNEAPTILLVIIVLLVVFKDSLPLDITTVAILGMIVAFGAAIQLYAKKRRLNQEQLLAAEQAGSEPAQ